MPDFISKESMRGELQRCINFVPHASSQYWEGPHLFDAWCELARVHKAACVPVWGIICGKGGEIPAVSVFVLQKVLSRLTHSQPGLYGHYLRTHKDMQT